jgi:hypothetical protein
VADIQTLADQKYENAFSLGQRRAAPGARTTRPRPVREAFKKHHNHCMPTLPKDDRAHLFKGLHSPLAPYISRAKLFSSAEFLDMVEFATESALTTGNYGHACQLVKFYDETPYQTVLVKWLEARAGLRVETGPTKVKIHKRANGTPLLVKLAEYFPEAQKASRERATELRMQQLESSGQVIKSRKRTDIMDTGRRLPGSIETGKRR